MFNEVLTSVLKNAWPAIVIFCIILITVRIFYLKNNRRRFVFYKEALSLLFLIYILILFELVTNTDRGLPGINLTPLVEITRYEFGSELFAYNIIGNIMLFFPFGLAISNYINTKKILEMALIVLIISFSIELIQYRIGRAFDIDDIILNVLGGISGFLVYISLSSVSKYLPNFLTSEFVYNILTILLIAGIGFYITTYIGIGWI